MAISFTIRNAIDKLHYFMGSRFYFGGIMHFDARVPVRTNMFKDLSKG